MNSEIKEGQVYRNRDKRRAHSYFAIENIGVDYVLVRYLNRCCVSVIRKDRLLRGEYTLNGYLNAEGRVEAGNHDFSQAEAIH